MKRRLARIHDVAGGAALPSYEAPRLGSGIVHIGLGAFHRAHQAIYTDDALAAAGGDWRIIGVGLRSVDIADQLNPQNGLYTLLTRGAEGTTARVVASIEKVLTGTRDRRAILAALADHRTRIVTMTVTEKGYGIDRTTRGIDSRHPAIAADMETPRAPAGVLGMIVEGLRRRKAAGIPAFTLLCCDNLPDNGKLLRGGVLDFAGRIDPRLRDWIAAETAFPSCMVDRITPVPSDITLADAERLTGCVDHAAVETEPFSQWVIEDDFPLGRPVWEAGGAIFVDDVAPYEMMKLRMLNGAHSLIAYAGYLSGYRFVRDAMQHPALARLVRRHFLAAARTLPPLPDMDLDRYADDLAARFANPALAHETSQIAMDGTEKLPQRLLQPATETLRAQGDLRPFAFAVAAWMRFCLGRTETGPGHVLEDPREEAIKAALRSADDNPAALADALHNLPGLFPEALTDSGRWRTSVNDALGRILQNGIESAIAEEARQHESTM